MYDTYADARWSKVDTGGNNTFESGTVNNRIYGSTPYITHIQYGHLVGSACNSAGYNSYRGHDTITIAKETGELLQDYTTIKICLLIEL